MSELTSAERLSKAIIALQGSVMKSASYKVKPQPFFAHLLMSLRFEPMPEWCPMRTMGVDAAGHCYYDDDFVKSLKDEEIVGTLIHEVMHAALLHLLRLGGRNKEIANIAQDIVVNAMVLRSQYRLPKDVVPYDINDDVSRFNLGPLKLRVENVSEKIWETIYDELMQQAKSQGYSIPEGSKGLRFDFHIYGNGDDVGKRKTEDGKADADGTDVLITPSVADELRKEWSKKLTDAATYAKQRGDLPGGMERFIKDILRPKVDWAAMLRNHVAPYLSPVDWSYRRLHRKSQALGVALPAILREHVQIGVVVDTSGSISQENLSEFLSEIVGMAQSLRHVEMEVAFVDAAVQKTYKVENGDIETILNMKPAGGGGTSMEVGLDYFKEKDEGIPVIIVLTDGCDSYRRREEDYPFEVIWCITEGGMKGMPYGEIISMGD